MCSVWWVWQWVSASDDDRSLGVISAMNEPHTETESKLSCRSFIREFFQGYRLGRYLWLIKMSFSYA